jgi:hypothetical protein
LKRGIRDLEKAEKNSDGEDDLDRRSDSSLSLRLCVAYDVRTSSRIAAILCDNWFSCSELGSSIVVRLTAKMKCESAKKWFWLLILKRDFFEFWIWAGGCFDYFGLKYMGCTVWMAHQCLTITFATLRDFSCALQNYQNTFVDCLKKS